MEKYHMRRQERQITDENEMKEILARGKFAVLSMCRGNEPYIVTLSYGYDEAQNCLYFHASPEGLKLDFIKENPQVCATVIEDLGYIQKECAHAYRSVVLFGTMAIAEDIREKKHGIEVLLNHLKENPDIIKEKYRLKEEGAYAKAAVLRLKIIGMTGKKGR